MVQLHLILTVVVFMAYLKTMSVHKQILGQLMNNELGQLMNNEFEIIRKEWLVTCPRLTIFASMPAIHY